MILPVVLCGGSGTRLWPLSRKSYPKQFIPFLGHGSLLQETILRLREIPECAPSILVASEQHRFIVAEQLRAIDVAPGSIILEPSARNTAPAVASAAFYAMESSGDPLLLVLPSDHVVRDPVVLGAAVEAGRPAAEAGMLVTFGIHPSAPETGYGYIRAGRPVPGSDGVYSVDAFVEKPDQKTAASYLADGSYFWNSGIFLFRASRYLEDLALFAPDIHKACLAAYENAVKDLDFLRLGVREFAACPSNSVDYAVMERTDRAAVVPMDPGWSDLGSWSALLDISPRDDAGNALLGDVIAQGTRNCYLRSGHRLLAVLGVQDLVVVETSDAVLVAHRDRVQDIKEIVKRLQDEKRPEAVDHRRVFRPWGSYEGVDASERFQVKRITVNPGAVLSLQMHHHRAEHWIVVRGTAKVTKGDETFLLTEDQSTYIPLGTVHRLENPGVIPLDLIEVQTGSYLGEDDIIRFEDLYGRHEPDVTQKSQNGPKVKGK